MRGEKRHVFVADEVFCVCVQVGDGSMTQRNTPVSVSGLGSGVAMIALGGVRFVAIASWRFTVLSRSVCIWLIVCGLESCYVVVRG